ncbi:unnamed protein product [Heterobilharzia americana]|nr:unnamed protein product [Heterobilharzia americana]
MVSDYVSSIKLEYRKLQTKIEKLEKENHLLAAELGYREPNFCGNILAFVESLFLNTKYSDVLFKTPDVLVPGHKFVLDARGGVWDIYTENGVEYIDMRGYCQSVCEALILWAYKGVLEKFEAECLSKLMVLAKEYCLPSLFSQCEIALIPLVTRENCLSLYSSSYDVKASKLLDHCFLFLSGVWQNLSSEEISTINAPVLQSFLERYSKFPVHSAIELGRDDTVMSLLEGNPVKARLLVNQLNENGLSPLRRYKCSYWSCRSKTPVAQFAFSNKLFDAVQFLLLHGSCCNFSDPISSRTLLHKLAVTDCKELSDSVIDIAKTLLKQDVNISCQDTNGNSPLHLSILHNNSDIFKLLLSCAKKPDLDLPNNQGLCPLWLALVSQLSPWDSFSPGVYGFHSDDLATHSCDFASLLIENGANVNYRFTDVCLSSLKSSMSSKVPLPGDTLLMAAARIGWESAALFLLDHPQCDPTLESTFTQGETVFHVAVEAELFELCNRLVVRKEIDPNRLRYSQVVVLNEDCEISKKVTCLEKVSGSKIVKSLNPFDDDYDSNIDPDVASNSVDNICHSNSSHGISNPTITSQQFSPTTPSSSVIIDNTEFTQQLYCSPLHLAVKHKMFELVKFYLQEKGDVDWSLLNESGESVFSLLLWSEEFQLINQVLEYMYSQSKNISDCNHNLSFRKSDEGINWFRNLISSKCNKSLSGKVLISQGADIDEKFFIENNFRTFVHPLWIALKLRKWEIANYLVDCGIDVNAWALFDPNVKITLLHRAICENNEEAAIFLVKRNCDVNVCPQLDNCKLSDETTNHSDYLMPYLARSPLHIAISVGMYELVKALVNCNRVHVNQQDYNGETPLHLAVNQEMKNC